jgi:hypothetical protein
MRCFGRSRPQEEAAVPKIAPEPTDADAARQAVREATTRLTESYRRWPDVRRAAGALGETQQANHFAEKIAEAYRSRN